MFERLLSWFLSGDAEPSTLKDDLLVPIESETTLTKLDDLKVLVDAIAAEAKADVDKAVAAMKAAADVLAAHAGDSPTIDAITETLNTVKDELSVALNEATDALTAATPPA